MKKLFAFTLTSVTLPFIIHSAYACTDFRLTAKDGTVLVARSMEFAVDMHANLRTQVRGANFTTTAPDGKPGLAWKAKYGYVYLDGMNQDKVIDGMNEKGLSFEALYLPGEAQYQEVPAGKDSAALPYISLGDWILGNFQTIDEIKAAIKNVYAFAQPLPGLGDTIFPLHFSVYDASGKGIVIEYTKGQLHEFDNDIGMLTNSPTYDWQVTNLRNYLNLSPYAPQPVKAYGLTFAATGQGSGSMGLPGDVSPPSRFTKIMFLKSYAIPALDASGTINLADHIINNVDIALGTVRAKQDNAPDALEFTQWVVFKDLSHKALYYRSYSDPTIREIAMDKLDFSEKATRLKMPISTQYTFTDETNNFLNAKA